MGCTHSTAEPDEVLWRCKERRNLMKQLLSCRAELAVAHVAYLRSLRNTGATLRQLTEAETTIIGGTPIRGLQLPPSPPPLPPSPPPPPNFSPVAAAAATKEELLVEDLSDSDADDDNFSLPPPPPPPPFLSAAWDSGDSLGSPASSASSSPMARRDKSAVVDDDEEEEEVVEEDEEDKLIQRKEALIVAMNRTREKELADDSLSTVSWLTKDTETAATVWRSKKSLEGTAKEIDEHFLKAEAAGKDVTVFLESEQDCLQSLGSNARKVKRSKSAKVVNVLSWSWSFRSSHSNRDAQDANNGTRPGTHCKTLEKIFAEEQRLYKQVKDEESVKSQHKKVLELLNKLDGGDHDRTKTERALLDAEELQCRIISLKESINETCLSISRLRDEDLCPQLVEFSVGLGKMWRTMFECHQVQNHISQQANLLDNNLGTDPTTDSHRQAISQLEAEVTFWYSSYCNLFKCQHEYFDVLNKWVRLTDCLPENSALTGSTQSIRGFCEQLQLVLDKLPVKNAAEAMEKFLLVIRSIIKQHNEEHSLRKRSDRLQSRLEKELKSLQTLHDGHRFQNPTHDPRPIRQLSSTRHDKIEALKRRAEEGKVKYLHSIRTSRAMMLNNLQTSLPNLFEALTEFSSQCVQALEGISTLSGAVTNLPASVSPVH